MSYSKTQCGRCGGRGLLTYSFQPDRTCDECCGAGIASLGNNVKPHTQIIHFRNGDKRTISDIVSVWENECVHLLTLDGVEWVINKNNVLCMERKILK